MFFVERKREETFEWASEGKRERVRPKLGLERNLGFAFVFDSQSEG